MAEACPWCSSAAGKLRLRAPGETPAPRGRRDREGCDEFEQLGYKMRGENLSFHKCSHSPSIADWKLKCFMVWPHLFSHRCPVRCTHTHLGDVHASISWTPYSGKEVPSPYALVHPRSASLPSMAMESSLPHEPILRIMDPQHRVEYLTCAGPRNLWCKLNTSPEP